MAVRPPRAKPKHPYYSRKRNHEMIYVDQFIMDCLLPTTDRSLKLRNSAAYELYRAYCHYSGCKLVHRVHFGRCMSKRFMRVQVAGYPYYLCELRPNLLEGVEL